MELEVIIVLARKDYTITDFLRKKVCTRELSEFPVSLRSRVIERVS